MAPLDFDRARRFISAVPPGRWTAYRDVAAAAGNPQGAQAVGDWLRRRGDEVPHVYRVLRVDGFVPDAFRPAGPGVPADSAMVRATLTEEGVRIDRRGRAAPHQRFTVADWTDDASATRGMLDR
jgi:alkylated DNA nucleotide flippase Atl1